MATITGTDGNDTLTGTAAADELVAREGNDVLISGGGMDTMTGGQGDDVYFVEGQVVIDERPDFFEEVYGIDTVSVSGNRFELTEFGTYRTYMAVEVLRASDPGRTLGITLIGNGYRQQITGGAGNDYLDAGLTGLTFTLDPARAGEVLTGLAGDDVYVVRNSAVAVAEATGGGDDTIVVDTYWIVNGGTYVLAPDSEIETIRIEGGVAINIIGNRFDQRITGNDDANILIGGGGTDTLVGLGGDDTFQVRSTRDVVVEEVDGGADIVYTTVSYNLGDNSVEALSTVDNSATDAIDLIGNFVSQTIVGNYGRNVLNGGSGADTLIGLRGDDVYAVGDGRIIIREAAGEGTDTVVTSVSYALGAGVSAEVLAAQDRSSTTGLALAGNEFGQTLAGTAGADTLAGGGGADVLIGGAGADRFDFAGALGSDNIDAISDFGVGDRIGLSTSVFGGVGANLEAGEFVAGTAAADADDRILYDAATGRLLYDADGNGAGAAVLFALVTPGTALGSADFAVI